MELPIKFANASVSSKKLAPSSNLASIAYDRLNISISSMDDLPKWWFDEIEKMAKNSSLKSGVSSEVAEDVAIDAVLVVARSLVSKSIKTSVSSFAKRVATNLTANTFREKSVPITSWSELDVEDSVTLKESTFQEVRDQIVNQAFEIALHKIFVGEQIDALRLYFVEGYSASEISTILGKKPGTVKTWLKRGTEKLRKSKHLLKFLDPVE